MTGGIPHSTVTLATIAAHLGVSRSTVSNAYNHPDQLSPQLRQKILDTAKSLGYTGPDPVARRLRKGRAGAIGVLFSEALQSAFSDSAAVLFLEGIASASENADTGMLLIPARPSEQNAGVVHDAMVDGFVLYSIPPQHPFVEVALGRRVPVVCVDQTRIEGVSWVGIDDKAASRAAAQHLIDLGHRKLAVLVYGLTVSTESSHEGDTEDNRPSVSQLRLDGYQEACEAAGIDWSDVRIIECSTNSETDGARALHSLVAGGDMPTGILCTSDALALGVLDVAGELGLTIPHDLSVVGFNDLPSASFSSPPLTTVRQPLKDKGARATALLLDHEVREPQTVHLQAELIVRSSTAKAPNQSAM